jgi:hypothetical protein
VRIDNGICSFAFEAALRCRAKSQLGLPERLTH